MAVLSIQNVVKQYAGHTAVNDVSFEVEEGSIFGLLGPNGAGKTSLIRIITRITAADSGRILLNGHALEDSKIREVGYLPEERGLYKKMMVGEHLLYLAQLKGLSKAEAVDQIKYWLDKFDIKTWWNKKIEELSKGMQQKVQFIATVLHRPSLIILDEPFTGLDPVNTNLIKSEINRLNQEGMSIIFSTHRMEQVEEICKDIVLIEQGKNILSGKVTDVKQQFKENLYKVATASPIQQAGKTFDVSQQGSDTSILRIHEGNSPNDVLSEIISTGNVIREFKEVLPSLNDIFIKLINKN
jgi:ABC-2 type transport system ATP-binding protein